MTEAEMLHREEERETRERKIRDQFTQGFENPWVWNAATGRWEAPGNPETQNWKGATK